MENEGRCEREVRGRRQLLDRGGSHTGRIDSHSSDDPWGYTAPTTKKIHIPSEKK